MGDRFGHVVPMPISCFSLISLKLQSLRKNRAPSDALAFPFTLFDPCDFCERFAIAEASREENLVCYTVPACLSPYCDETSHFDCPVPEHGPAHLGVQQRPAPGQVRFVIDRKSVV